MPFPRVTYDICILEAHYVRTYSSDTRIHPHASSAMHNVRQLGAVAECNEPNRESRLLMRQLIGVRKSNVTLHSLMYCG